MNSFSRYVIFGLGILTILSLMTACTGNAIQVKSSATSRPTFTPPPSRTPRPSQTPLPTATWTPTATPFLTVTPSHTPKPTFQLPKLALTSLPFIPEPISPLNAGQITKLTHWEITNPAFWKKQDGNLTLAVETFQSAYIFRIAFSNDGTILLFPIANQSFGSGFALYSSPNGCSYSTPGGCKSNSAADICEFPGIPRLLILNESFIDLISPGEKVAGFRLSMNGENLAIQIYPDCLVRFIQLQTESETEAKIPFGNFSVDGRIWWSWSNRDNKILFFDPENGELLQKIKVNWRHLAELTKAEAEWITTNLTEAQQQEFKNDLVNYQMMKILDLSPDRKTFISSIHMNTNRLYYWSDSLMGFLEVNPKGILRIILWRASDGAMLHVLLEKDEWEGEPIAVYSPDSKQVAVFPGSDPGIYLFDVLTGKKIDQLGESGYLNLSYSPDGQILIAGTNASLELWDIATGNLLAEIPIPAKLDDWAISPDGRYIGTVSEDGIINLWGVAP